MPFIIWHTNWGSVFLIPFRVVDSEFSTVFGTSFEGALLRPVECRRTLPRVTFCHNVSFPLEYRWFCTRTFSVVLLWFLVGFNNGRAAVSILGVFEMSRHVQRFRKALNRIDRYVGIKIENKGIFRRQAAGHQASANLLLTKSQAGSPRLIKQALNHSTLHYQYEARQRGF